MKNIKRNESGFTLVELVVVVALMAIVFGALMNIIKPTSTFFKESEQFKDELMISEGLTEALASEVRYSTNVLVLQNYVGVPVISGEGKIAGVDDVVFDSVILIENDNVRGSYKANYDADATSARRKGATGQIVTFDVTTSGLMFLTNDLLYREDFYGDYDYDFSVSGKTDENGRSYIDFGVSMNALVNDGSGNYTPNEDNYESREFLYLTNINLKDNDGYQLYVKDFQSATDDSAYVGFERATTPAAASSNVQKSLYKKDDASNSHTWIIYYTGKSIEESSTVKITLDPGEGGGGSVIVNYPIGTTMSVVPFSTLPASGYETYTDTSTGNTYARRFKGWRSSIDTSVLLTNEELLYYVLMFDETFTAEYDLINATYSVTFYDSAANVLSSFPAVEHGDPVSVPDMSSSVPAGYDGYCWKLKGTEKTIVDNSEFTSVTRNLDVEPYYYKNCTIKFVEQDLTTVVETKSLITGQEITNIPAVPEISGYTGEWMLYNADGTTSVANFGAVSEDMTFVAVYTEIPPASAQLTVSDISVTDQNWGRCVDSIYFKVTNTGTADITNFKITVPMNGAVEGICNSWGSLVSQSGTSISYAGNNIVITCSGVTIAPGNAMDITMQVYVSEYGITGDPFATDIS